MTANSHLKVSIHKLRWAKSIYSTLRTEIQSVEVLGSHRISVKVDEGSGEYEFYIHDLPTLDPTWGLRVGDALHSARSALDYLMVGLVALGTGRKPQDVEDVQFPIYSEQKQFNGAIGNLKKYPILAGWLSRVEELQPYHAGNPSIWGWSEDGLGEEAMPRLPLGLDRLTTLDNIDKHRCILHPYNGPRFWGGSLVGRVRYEAPLPHLWVPTQEDMKRNYPIQVSFNEPSLDKSVVHIVAWC